MNPKKLLFLVLICVFVNEQILNAQIDSVKINLPINKISFSDFVKEIEKSGKYKFFYNPEWVDSIDIDAYYQSVPLSETLKQILTPKKLFYFISRHGNIIITRDAPIQEVLPEELVEVNTKPVVNNSTSTTNSDINAKYSGEIDKEKLEELTIGTKNGSKVASIRGFIKDQETGEPIIGATIFNEELKQGVSTDISGYYILNSKPGTYTVSISAIGLATIKKRVILNSDGQLNLEMGKEGISLNEVVIKQEKYSNIRGMQIGLEKLSMKQIKALPLAVGERDILKAALFLPGIQTVGESAAGYNVRGGAVDQNLFLINNVPVYNTSHMLGFFSTINADVVKDFKLFKSNIPIEYGGRISSIFDIRTNQGNNKNFSMKGGISPVTARLLFEGPIIKDKSSYLLGIRSTYSNWILRQIKNPDVSNSNAYFNDVTLNISHEIDQNNQINVFGYFSTDKYSLATNITYNYSNFGTSLSWKHIFNSKLFFNSSAVFSNYHLKMSDKYYPDLAYNFTHDVKHHEINLVYTYLPDNKHEIKFGFSSILYKIDPGSYNPINQESTYLQKSFNTETAIESAIFVGDKYEINNKLSVEGGLRFSFYNYLGPKTIYTYRENEPISANSVVDTTYYKDFQSIKDYTGLDFRISARYLFNGFNSLKLGFSRINQFLFLLSNSTSVSPTDRWKLCDPFSKPIVGDQYNIGYYHSFGKMDYESSVEFYYKENKNIPDFKNGADLLKNEHIEWDILSGFGRGYGMEFMLRKNSGKLTGWINYAYSKSELRFPVKSTSETINNGNYYPTNYDKPHCVNFVANYHTNRRLSVSANFTYNTGRPYTPPVDKYTINDHTIITYADRNAERVPDYYRVDLSFNLEGNFIRKKLAHSFWMFTVYNLTGRKNVYSIFFETNEGKIKAYKISVFGTPIFTLSYNFKFGNYASN